MKIKILLRLKNVTKNVVHKYNRLIALCLLLFVFLEPVPSTYFDKKWLPQ